ncbi:MAG: PAS domain S-box protein [Phycisphaerales bacterium]|nr:PAS domain S-box protein [Phycisphaerales bacterium]
MSHFPPSYEELARRCRKAEALLEAIRSGRTETMEGDEGTVILRLAEVEERAAHIKQVLLAIRNVNQLIVQENDPQRLIERACTLLTETMGYFNAWIALLDESGKTVTRTAAAGFDGGFDILRGGLERGEFPPCMSRALAQDAPVVVEDPPTGCPVAGEYGGRAGLAHRLAFDGRLFGILVVSVPGAYAHDDEEQRLFQEVACDLAFALHKIDSEACHLAERLQAERNLNSAYSKLQALWSVASLSDANIKNVADHILASIVRMTQSRYGFYGFVNDDESIMTIHAWSGEAMQDCSLVDQPQVFPVCKAGIWAEAIRRRETLIVNDYAAVHEAKKGLPPGHVALTNLLVVPFYAHGKITAVAAVANRPADYTAEDATQLNAFLTSIQAISEGKRAEEALRIVRYSVDHLADSMFWINEQGAVMDVNEAACRNLGYSRAELLTMCVADIDPHFPAEKWPSHWEEIQQRGVMVMETEHRTKIGELLPMELVIHNQEFGNVRYNCVLGRDVTERKRAEMALRESEDRCRRIVDTAQEGIWVMDARRRTTFVNPRMAEMLGFAPEEMLGRPVEDFMYAEDLGDHTQRMRERYQGRAGRYERRFRGKDGREIWTSVSAVALKDHAGRFAGSFGMFADITEYKRAEEEHRCLEEHFRQLQKMDAAGRLAAGFAHDLANLLSVIRSQIERVNLAAGLDEPAREGLAMIQQAAKQATAMIEALRTFGRAEPTHKLPVNLGEVVREAEPILRYSLPARIKLDIELPSESLPPVMADRAQIHQVMLNLALNARDAMPDGGRLRVAVTCGDALEVRPDDRGPPAGPGHVRLSFVDTGAGMSPETLERAFEPFFSTKPRDRGTGLGLLIVQGIVNEHDGRIQIESRVHHGTAVHILLPIVSHQIVEDAEPPPASGNGELILLAGGSRYLRGTIAAYLDSLQYQILLCDDENSVLAQWGKRGPETRLLIISVTDSPDEFPSHLQAILDDEPRVPVIILCGKDGFAQATNDKRTIIISEPFCMTDLAGAVSRILTVPAG